MLILNSVNDLLQVVTTVAGSVDVHVSWADFTTPSTVAPNRTNTNSIITAATTTILASPAGGTQRNAKGIVIRNLGAAQPGFTVQHFDGALTKQLWFGTLGAGDALVYDEEGRWNYYVGGILRTSPGSGQLIQIITLTSGTSFTTSAQTNKIRVRLQAGGGGGGGANTAATSAAAGSGGAAGGYAEKIFTVSPNTAYTYAIGAAGAAGAAAGGNGTAGGNTTFTVSGTTVTAFGGPLGTGSAAAATPLTIAGGAAPAISTNGDVNGSGGPGGASNRQSATIAESGGGGSSAFGGGGVGRVAQSAGANGTGFGAGGSGGCCINGGAAAAGGAGTAGLIIVEEFT